MLGEDDVFRQPEKRHGARGRLPCMEVLGVPAGDMARLDAHRPAVSSTTHENFAALARLGGLVPTHAGLTSNKPLARRPCGYMDTPTGAAISHASPEHKLHNQSSTVSDRKHCTARATTLNRERATRSRSTQARVYHAPRSVPHRHPKAHKNTRTQNTRSSKRVHTTEPKEVRSAFTRRHEAH